VKSRGQLDAGIQPINFTSTRGRGPRTVLEHALAHWPVFVGIAKPPQQMPACLKGAG
jgi:hypothetical protein